ncbi:MAG: hypothetical protein IIX32_06095 [Alistipes sp.]|nr:hypothetical protein [Alistipes sp.]
MKTIKHFALALVAVACGLGFTSCDQNKPDDYSNYPQLIVGKWFNFTPESSVFKTFNADGTLKVVGFDKETGWMADDGTYRLEGNKTTEIINKNGSLVEYVREVEVSNQRYVIKAGAEFGEKIHYRVQEQFDIKGNYSYLNSAVRVVAAEGKTALQLPEGVTFQGQNSIPVDAMHGDRIIDVMKKFFADATFAADGALNHTLDGEAKTKNYTLDGNNLTFNLYEGSETYKVNATSFPDEDGDRLFIIIPKQAAWLGGMVDLVEKEQEGLKLTEAQIAELEKEFMATFETFTVVLSLSKK